MKQHIFTAAALPLMLALACIPAEAAVHRCTDPSGKVSYQESPCPDASAARTLPEAGASKGRGGAASQQRGSRQEDGQVDDWDADDPAFVLGDGRKPAPGAASNRAPARPVFAEVPRVSLKFELLSVTGSRQRWTNSGPEGGRRFDGTVRGGSIVEDAALPAVVSENGSEAYTLKGNGGTLAWMPKGFGGPVQELTPPSRLPALSWASGLAWDTRKGVLGIASHGGEGYFHRYDTRNHTWLDARSLKNLDLIGLAFDEMTGTYVGFSKDAQLVTFNDQGDIRQVRPLVDVLPGLRGTFDRVPHASGITLAARGGVIAIVNVRKASVTHIWTYETATARAQLTYKAAP
jgi:hypothetical protein